MRTRPSELGRTGRGERFTSGEFYLVMSGPEPCSLRSEIRSNFELVLWRWPHLAKCRECQSLSSPWLATHALVSQPELGTAALKWSFSVSCCPSLLPPDVPVPTSLKGTWHVLPMESWPCPRPSTFCPLAFSRLSPATPNLLPSPTILSTLLHCGLLSFLIVLEPRVSRTPHYL